MKRIESVHSGRSLGGERQLIFSWQRQVSRAQSLQCFSCQPKKYRSPRAQPHRRAPMRSVQSVQSVFVRISKLLEPARAAVAVLGRGERCRRSTALEIRIERSERIERKRQTSPLPSAEFFPVHRFDSSLIGLIRAQRSRQLLFSPAIPRRNQSPRNSPTGASVSMWSQRILNVASNGTAMNAPATPQISHQRISPSRIATGLSVSRRPMRSGVST
jgi:hypothetical protein